MQDVVAVVGHQDRVLLVQVENLAQRIALFGEQVHVLDVLDQCPAIAFGQGGVGRIGDATQQHQVQIQYPRQGTLVQGQSAGGQQCQGHQVDRVDRRGFVEVACHAFAEAVGGCAQPVRLELRAQLLGQSGCSWSRNSASLIGSPKLTATWPKRCLRAPMTLKMSKIDSFFLLAPRSSPR